MILPALYHWSPTERRELIRAEGLKPFSPRVTHSEGRAPYLSFSPTPSCAWGLSGDFNEDSGIDDWDLWQVRVSDDDDVHIRPEFGPVIKEIQIRNPISADRLWFVGSRTSPSFEEEK